MRRLLVLVLVGCGGGKGDVSADTSPPSASDTDPGDTTGPGDDDDGPVGDDDDGPTGDDDDTVPSGDDDDTVPGDDDDDTVSGTDTGDPTGGGTTETGTPTGTPTGGTTGGGTTDTGTPPTGTTPTALSPGFEADLTDVFGCEGSFFAANADDTIQLGFDVNDLAGAAHVSGVDTQTVLDLAVDGWRLEVRLGAYLSTDTCFGTGVATVDATYTAVAGAAVVDIYPHNQLEQTEGALTLTDVTLEAPGLPDVQLPSLVVPQLNITAI